MKALLSCLLFVINLFVWGWLWYILSSDPRFNLPLLIAFLTFLICYFLLPKFFFQIDQKLFSLTTYDYIWAQLKWANGVGFTTGFILVILQGM